MYFKHWKNDHTFWFLRLQMILSKLLEFYLLFLVVHCVCVFLYTFIVEYHTYPE